MVATSSLHRLLSLEAMVEWKHVWQIGAQQGGKAAHNVSAKL